MNWLALDTSTEQASVALSVDGVMHTATETNIRQHAKFLLPMIEELILSANSSYQDLNGIVFGCGPGSFTGLRIACSVAQGLAYALGLPLYPVNSLHAISAEAFEATFAYEHAPGLTPGVLAILDARMHEVYWAYYTRPNASSSCHVSPAYQIEIPSSGPLILAGVGLETYGPKLNQDIGARVIQQYPVFPQAAVMIRLVESGKIEAVAVEKALPTYVRHHVTQGAPLG